MSATVTGLNGTETTVTQAFSVLPAVSSSSEAGEEAEVVPIESETNSTAEATANSTQVELRAQAESDFTAWLSLL